MTVSILVGDVREKLRGLPADSFDCVVTSPPYWGLRKYLPPDAVRIRRDLDDVQRAYVLAELAKAGVK
jgi:DNA modification methylase